MKGVYHKSLADKNIASLVLLPLIEFEFGFLGDDSPGLIQSPVNSEQFHTIFKICKKHGWTVSDKPRMKGENLFFRVSKKGFKEIHELAGPFAGSRKKEWANLILEREGLIGGYQGDKKATEVRVREYLEKRKDWTTLQQICLNLRILPGTVREGIKRLTDSGLVERKREGKAAYWRIKAFSPSTSPAATAE